MPVLKYHRMRSLLRSAEWSAILLSIVGLGSGSLFCHAQSSQDAHIAACGQTTVDDNWGPEYASQAKVFLAALQRVVKSDDKKQLSLLVRYPVHIYDGNHKSMVRTPAEFIRQYPSIMSPDLKRAIIAQSPECLFATGQGVMIGDGNLWFQQQQSGQMKIITFNETKTDGRPRP
jgi:hypothetical protein